MTKLDTIYGYQNYTVLICQRVHSPSLCDFNKETENRFNSPKFVFAVDQLQIQSDNYHTFDVITEWFAHQNTHTPFQTQSVNRDRGNHQQAIIRERRASVDHSDCSSFVHEITFNSRVCARSASQVMRGFRLLAGNSNSVAVFFSG